MSPGPRPGPSATSAKRRIANHPVLAYYALAFAVSWGAILLLVGPGGFLQTTSTSPAFALVGFASLLGPSVAGILMTAFLDGRPGLRELRSRLLRWRVGARWYAVALLTAPIVTSLILFALSVVSPAFLPAILTSDDKAGLVLAGIAVGLTVSVFEELGWTGFVTPRLRLRHGVLGTGLLMGLLWGTWHLPLFAGSAASSGSIPPVVFMAAMLFSWLPPYRVLMVWVHDRTRSLLLVMLMHLPIVVGQFVLTPEGISGEAMFVSLVVTGVVLWLVVGAVALANGGRITKDESDLAIEGDEAGGRAVASVAVWRALSKASFAVIGHVNSAGEPRSSGVVYGTAGRRLYVAVAADGRKAREIMTGQDVAVTVPVRRGGLLSLLLPIPPATISFRARVTVHPAGTLDISSVSEDLERLVPESRKAGSCVLELVPEGRFLTYGVGVSLMAMANPAVALARVPVA